MQKIIRDFTLIWATIDPIGNLALFAGLTASLDRGERQRVARRASIYATVILVVAVVIGQIVLDAMGVHLLSLQVAGGIILFIFALKMLFGSMDQDDSREPGKDIAIFPLAVPAIAGPGAIMGVIILTDNDVYTIPQQVQTAVVLVVVLALNYLLLRMSDGVLRVIGRQGAAILVRVMGILLAALSVELVLKALSVPGWVAPKA